MAELINIPFSVFPDVDGDPLDDGYIYIGETGLNAEVNPISVYWDSALSIPAAQPVRTINGFPSRNGSPARMYVFEPDYSISVRNKNGSFVYSSLTNTGLSLAGTSPATVANVATMRFIDPVSSVRLYLKAHTIEGDGGHGFFRGVTGAAAGTYTDNGGTIIVPTGGDGSAAWLREYSGAVTPEMFGATGDGTTNDTTALQAAEAVSSDIYLTDTYLVTAYSSVTFSKYRGPGNIKISTTTLPVDRIATNLTLPVPSVFPLIQDALDYLENVRISEGAIATISLAAGSHAVATDAGLEPYHVDGERIYIQGAGSATTTIQYDFSGSAGASKAGLKLQGNYSLGLFDGVTMNGDDWSGHTDGGPTLGGGDPEDPIGILAREGAKIKLGSDVKVYRFARNGVIAYMSAAIYAPSVEVVETGSDGIVASTASSVYCVGATVTDVWGVGVFADYTGIIWAGSTTVTGSKLRGGTAGGDGFSAANGGQIYADSSTSIKNADTGYTCYGGGIVFAASATAGGSALNANTTHGIRCQHGGKFIGTDAIASYNGSGGVYIGTGAQFIGNGLTASNNTGIGLYALDGGIAVADGIVAASNTSHGVSAERGAYAAVIGGDMQSNGGSGINCSSATVRATSLVALSNNTAYGAISRYSGIIDMSGVSEATVVTGNTSGTTSPAKDDTTGIADSFIYLAA